MSRQDFREPEYDERKKDRRRTLETAKTQMVILDANVFREYGPSAVFHYGKNDIIIPAPVRDELNHQKTTKGQKGENCRRLKNFRETLSFFEKITETYSLSEIKDGIRISGLASFVFGKQVRSTSAGLIFLSTKEPRNDPELFSKEFKNGEVISVTVKLADGEEQSVPVSKEIGLRIRRALWDIQDREILAIAVELQKSGKDVLLITGDIHLRAEARLKGIEAKEHRPDDNALSSKNASQNPGRRTHQRRVKSNWN